MTKAGWLAIPVVLLAHAAAGNTRHAGAPPPARASVQPAVVMFGLAIVRHHMLDTLVELIGKPCGAGRSRRPALPKHMAD